MNRLPWRGTFDTCSILCTGSGLYHGLNDAWAPILGFTFSGDRSHLYIFPDNKITPDCTASFVIYRCATIGARWLKGPKIDSEWVPDSTILIIVSGTFTVHSVLWFHFLTGQLTVFFWHKTQNQVERQGTWRDDIGSITKSRGTGHLNTLSFRIHIPRWNFEQASFAWACLLRI